MQRWFNVATANSGGFPNVPRLLVYRRERWKMPDEL